MSLANDLAYAAKHNKKSPMRRKITDAQVDEIRKMAARREKRHWQIAEIFGVTRSYVSNLARTR